MLSYLGMRYPIWSDAKTFVEGTLLAMCGIRRRITIYPSIHHTPPCPIYCTSHATPIRNISDIPSLLSRLKLTLGKLTPGTITGFKAEGASLTFPANLS